MADRTLLTLFRHKTWATLRLLEACQALTDDQLGQTIPGTFGSIQATLQHLVGAEEAYFFRVTGERFFERMTEDPVPLSEMADRIRALGPRWEALIEDPEAGEREVTTSDGWHWPASILIAQAVHHADDHRSHVLSIIGSLGFEVPGVDIGEDFDVWHYAFASGEGQTSEGGD
jgi:uncharacterized damage-inducible protein DinB